MNQRVAASALADALSGVGVIALDWNGTVVRDTDRAHRATNRVLGDAELPELSYLQFRRKFQLPLKDFFRDLGIGEAELERAESGWNSYLSEEMPEPNFGIDALFDAANALRLPVGVVSAGKEHVVRHDAELVGVSESLAFLYGSSRAKSETLSELSQAHCGRLMYFGDTAYDILQAKQVGAIAVAVVGGYSRIDILLSAEPDFVIEEFWSVAESLPIQD